VVYTYDISSEDGELVFCRLWKDFNLKSPPLTITYRLSIQRLNASTPQTPQQCIQHTQLSSLETASGLTNSPASALNRTPTVPSRPPTTSTASRSPPTPSSSLSSPSRFLPTSSPLASPVAPQLSLSPWCRVLSWRSWAMRGESCPGRISGSRMAF